MTRTLPNESTAYREARNALLNTEYEVQELTERVAAARRALPQGGEIPEDYAFQRLDSAGQEQTVHLSELFSPDKQSLFIYSLMFGPDRESPCPGCTSLLEQLSSIGDVLNKDVDFVIAARSPIQRLEELAKRKRWTQFRFVSTADTTYNQDYHGTTTDGYDLPMVNVFRKEDGAVRHFWGSEMLYEPSDPGQDPRANDSLSSLWNMLDLTRDGRGTTWWPDVETPKIPLPVAAD